VRFFKGLMQQLFALLVVLVFKDIKVDPGDFRPPAVPLIVFSPHVSGKRDFNFTRKKRRRRMEDSTQDRSLIQYFCFSLVFF